MNEYTGYCADDYKVNDAYLMSDAELFKVETGISIVDQVKDRIDEMVNLGYWKCSTVAY